MLSTAQRPGQSPAQRMNRMYRYTRHIYDFTRRPYLRGRNGILMQIAEQPSGAILEVGCGTARNLRYLHRHAPHHSLYGLDASSAMLATARSSYAHEGSAHAIRLVQGEAQNVTPSMVGRTAPLDMVLCSYVLSMIPNPKTAVDTALAVLRPGGRVYLVDFWDQEGWPVLVRRAFQQWLAWFGVYHHPGLHRYLDALAERGRIRLTRTAVAGRYAYQAVLVKRRT